MKILIMDESDKVFYGNMCFVCHLTVKEKKLKKCSSCKLVFYCSEAHQKIHWKQHGPLCRVIQKIDILLKPKDLEDNIGWYKYRTNLLMLCELKLGRKLKSHETNMILFPNNCQVCHKKSDLQPCLNCLCINYCSEDHKKADFSSHKDICHLFALCVELDLYLQKSHFYPTYSLWEEHFSLLDSIEEFIKNNVKIKKHNAIENLQQTALVSELLTCPLSLVFALEQIKYSFGEKVTIHVVGCNFLETASPESWETILHIKPSIKYLTIHFIGPEVKENCFSNLCSSCKKKITIEYFSNFYHNYLKSSSFQNPEIICSFNCGFHEFENSDMDTWIETLPLLIQNKAVPLIFTSFTENEAKKDSQILKKINKNLNVKILKNKFSSLRPYRDLENLGIYFNNEYVVTVLNNS